MKLRSVALATILTVLVAAPVTPAAAAQRTLVVDDDQQQCPKADYTSINAAIAAISEYSRSFFSTGSASL